MKIDRSLIGWILAAVFAAALGGVVIYEATNDSGGGRSAAIGASGQGNGPPPEVAADVNAILDAKNKAGKDKLPTIPPGQNPTQLDSNPQQHCDPSGDHPNVFAEWRNTPENVNQAAAQADQVVVGTAEDFSAGQSYITKVPGEPGGQVETPVQNVTIHVDQSVKGSARAGGVVTIQRLGDAEGCYRVAGDPPYQRGQQYLLLLENGAGGRPPHPIAPEGRYAVHANGALEAVTNTPAAQEAQELGLAKVVAKLH